MLFSLQTIHTYHLHKLNSVYITKAILLVLPSTRQLVCTCEDLQKWCRNIVTKHTPKHANNIVNSMRQLPQLVTAGLQQTAATCLSDMLSSSVAHVQGSTRLCILYRGHVSCTKPQQHRYVDHQTPRPA